MKSTYISALALAYVTSVNGHSWLACTDYRGDASYYENDKCFGYPRNWEAARGGAVNPIANGYHIGIDTGYNFQAEGCEYDVNEGYTANFGKATYEAGKTYCLAWPTKNHAAAACSNSFIPDTQMSIYRSTKGATTNPTQAEFFQNSVVTNFGKHQSGQQDCLGFQRAPKFCDNTDKAMATGCFIAPDEPGDYGFQWYWIFNPGSPYTSCWDATVVAADSGTGEGGLTGVDQVGDFCLKNWNTVAFAGKGGNPDAPSPTEAPSTTTSPPDPVAAPSGECPFNVEFTVNNEWGTGFTASVDITAKKALTEWTVSFALPTGVQVQNAWNTQHSAANGQSLFKSTGGNGNLAVGATASFGFQGSKNNGALAVPVTFITNGVICSTGADAPTSAPEAGPTAAPVVPTTAAPVVLECSGNGANVQPEGACVKHCVCNAGFFGPNCASTTAVGFVDMEISAENDPTYDISACDRQTEYLVLLAGLLPNTKVVLWDVTVTGTKLLEFRIYFNVADAALAASVKSDTDRFFAAMPFIERSETTVTANEETQITDQNAQDPAAAGADMTMLIAGGAGIVVLVAVVAFFVKKPAADEGRV